MSTNCVADDRDQLADDAARFAARRINLRITRPASRTSEQFADGWERLAEGSVLIAECGVQSADDANTVPVGRIFLRVRRNQAAAGSFENATGAVIFAERAARRANESLPVAERIAKKADGAAA